MVYLTIIYIYLIKIHRSLVDRQSHLPRLYGLPKIRKANVPSRPIVNLIGIPTYNVIKYLGNRSIENLEKTSSLVQNWSNFISLLSSLNTDPNDLLIHSFSLKTLFLIQSLKSRIYEYKVKNVKSYLFLSTNVLVEPYPLSMVII